MKTTTLSVNNCVIKTVVCVHTIRVFNKNFAHSPVIMNQ